MLDEIAGWRGERGAGRRPALRHPALGFRVPAFSARRDTDAGAQAHRKRGGADRRASRPCRAAGGAHRRRARRLRARRLSRHRLGAPAMARPHRRDPGRRHQRRSGHTRTDRLLPVPSVHAHQAGEKRKARADRYGRGPDRRRKRRAGWLRFSAIDAADKRPKNCYTEIAWRMGLAMDVKDFMPGDEVIAGIRADLEKYEAERRKARRSVRWRVPLFLGLLLALVVGLAYVFNGVADPNEQWFSTPHVFLYVIAFISAFFVYFAAVKPATRLQQSFRERILPLIFGFIEKMGYKHAETPASFRAAAARNDRLVQPRELRRRHLGALRGFSFRALRGDADAEGRKVVIGGFQGDYRSVRDDHAIPGAACGRRARPIWLSASFAASSAGASSKNCKAGSRRWTTPMNSAPTMSKRRVRW